MTDEPTPSRRAFLAGTAATGAGLVATAATAQTPDPLITEVGWAWLMDSKNASTV